MSATELRKKIAAEAFRMGALQAMVAVAAVGAQDHYIEGDDGVRHDVQDLLMHISQAIDDHAVRLHALAEEPAAKGGRGVAETATTN